MSAAIELTARERYALYLQSEHWQKLREAKLNAAGWKCNRCHSTRDLQVHHQIYRHPWESALLSDLEVLCDPCHDKEHALNPRRARKAKLVFGTFEEVKEARKNLRITRKQFVRLKKRFVRPFGKPSRRRRPNQPVWMNTTKYRNWVNLGNSSN